jgi:hypothetical protein
MSPSDLLIFLNLIAADPLPIPLQILNLVGGGLCSLLGVRRGLLVEPVVCAGG